MGQFLVQLVDDEKGVELCHFTLPNLLAYEGMGIVYGQMFLPYQDAMNFQLGVSGPTLRSAGARPNPLLGDVNFDAHLTLAVCGGDDANEGGCYSQAMRDTFGYGRQTTTFTAWMQADGGAFVSQPKVFTNPHVWFPQDGNDWDLVWTTDIEQPPEEWSPRQDWEPVVGYPWQNPRKKCLEEHDNEDPPVQYNRAYMDPSGDHPELRWLCDFRKIGGFPLNVVFLSDAGSSKLVAVALFQTGVLLRPGTSLHVRYQARIFGQVSREFALRCAKYAFEQTGSRYEAICCRPLLATAPQITRRTTYADLVPFFDAEFDEAVLSTWSFVPYSVGPPEVFPHVKSTTAPQWENTSEETVGPFGGLAVYGVVDGVEELMWVTPIVPSASVPEGDLLRVPDGVRFQLDGI